MKKIEKIGMFMVPSSADEFIVDILAKIAEKTDEIIDRLNEQPKEEYHYFNGNEPIKDKEIIGFMEGLPERVWEGTPEETGRWEERLNNLKARLNGFPVVVEKEIDDIKEIVKQELGKAREEGYQKGLEDSYEDYDGRLNDPEVREKLGLSKLNK